MRCLIVGGGIAGLCLAVGLRDTGHEVDLVEAQSDWTVYGVGIIQQANVVRAMADLGLLDKYLQASFAFDSVGVYDSQGNLKNKFSSPRLAGPEYPANLGVSRLALHKLLVTEARERGTNIRIGTRVATLDDTGGAVDVKFSDGSESSYDLVIGCDGAHSQLRTYVLGEKLAPRSTGQGVWRHNFPRTPSIDHLAMYMGPRGNAGLVPLAHDLMYMFLTTTETVGVRFPAKELHTLMRERLSDFGGEIAVLREQITDPAAVVYRPLETVFSPQWYRGRVLILGDAAHTSTPHLGQGAGIAIEDAVVLRDELAKPRPVEGTLRAFVERRFERCRYITALSAQVGDWEIEQSHHGERMAALSESAAFMAQPI